MGNIINLRRARKQKLRTDKHESSALSTVVSGVKKSERNRADRLNQMAKDKLNNHKREDED